MKIFAGSGSQDLGEKVSTHLGIDLSEVEHHIFPDGEQRVMLKEPVVGEDVVLIQSTGMPTDVHLIELYFLIDAARRNGAKTITCVVPYVGYSRQDHVFREGESRSLEVVVRFMEMTGGTRFIAFDLHSVKIPEIFNKPIKHLSALPLFAKTIKERGWESEDTVLASPDMGGLARLSKLSEMLSGMGQIAVEKNRDLTTGHIGAEIVHGEVKRRVLLVDDMISSGKTMVQAINMLMERGVIIMNNKEGKQTKITRREAVKMLIPATIGAPLFFVSVAPLLAEAIRRIESGESISKDLIL